MVSERQAPRFDCKYAAVGGKAGVVACLAEARNDLLVGED